MDLLIFDKAESGDLIGVESGLVLRYVDSAPSNMVPQPNARRGIIGAAALSWAGGDQSPVALVDALFALTLRGRPAKVSGLLLVRGADTVMGLLAAESPRPQIINAAGAYADWPSHPQAGALRRVPVDLESKPLWVLDPSALANRLLG